MFIILISPLGNVWLAIFIYKIFFVDPFFYLSFIYKIFGATYDSVTFLLASFYCMRKTIAKCNGEHI